MMIRSVACLSVTYWVAAFGGLPALAQFPAPPQQPLPQAPSKASAQAPAQAPTLAPALAPAPAQAPTQAPGQALPQTPAQAPVPDLSQAAKLTEGFDRDPVSGWGYSCEHNFVATDKGRALATRGGGHAIWEAAGEVSDFTLMFRFGYDRGTADVFFRNTETAGGHEFYCLMFEPNQVVLARRPHVPGRDVPQKVLARAPFKLSPQSWHDVVVRAAGPDITVWIDKQQVLQARDPQPLRSGPCGLGVIAQSGMVVYDDVALVPQGQVAQGTAGGGLASQPAAATVPVQQWGSAVSP